MTLLGSFALWAAFLLGLWGAGLTFFGDWRRNPATALAVRRCVYAICAALLVAALSLWKGIFSHDFNIEYVWAYTSRNLPEYYLVSAFWAGQKGSMLFWAVVLSIFAALAQALTSQRHKDLLPYVAGVTNLVIIFFVGVMLFAHHSNPFERMLVTPADGNGLNPQLQNPGMVMHPPMLYLGYISITIPFAFGIAAMLAGKLDAGWIIAMRKWALASWLFLSVGITLGMWWAYVELGWGGVWAWDPVENASLLPWLVLTAFLHSVMIQEKRGMLKRWNMALVVGAFLLSIFGTFITRSGVISSVHSFTQSDIGYYFLAFLLMSAILSFTAALYPLALPRGRGAAGVVGEPRIGVPVQQPRTGGHRVLGPVGHPLPDSLRSSTGHQDLGWPAVLQSGEHSAGAPPALPHRRRSADCVAQGVDRQPAATVHPADRRLCADHRRPAARRHADVLRRSCRSRWLRS